MKNRVFLGLLCLCAAFLGGLLRSAVPTASAQSVMQTPAQAGRYSIATDSSTLYFADTKTGRLWYYNTGLVVNEKGVPEKPTWRELPSPIVGASHNP